MEAMAQRRPVLVLMAGLPGAGKTTLSSMLGHITGWSVLHKDDVKDSFLLQGVSDREASWQAYELSFTSIYNLLVVQQTSVIFDTSASNPFVLERARELSVKAHAYLKVVHCHVHEDIRSLRLEGRPHITGPLNPCQLSAKERLALFQHLPDNTLHLDTSHSLNACIRIAQHYLCCTEE